MAEGYDITKKGSPVSTKGLILKTNEGQTGVNMYGITARGYKKKIKNEDHQFIIAKKV